MNGLTPPSFDEVELALRHAGALGEPAELHGQLCGLVCLMGAEAGAPWVVESLSDSRLADADRAGAAPVMALLADRTISALHEGDMSLTLLLPDDDEPLCARADELGQWCQGFLHGLGVGSVERVGDDAQSTLLEHEVTREIIEDLGEIARAGFEGDQADDSAEADYAELVEFVRVSAQLFFDEMAAVRAAGAERGQPS